MISRAQIAALLVAADDIRLACIGVVIAFDVSFDEGGGPGEYLILPVCLLEFGALVYWD